MFLAGDNARKRKMPENKARDAIVVYPYLFVAIHPSFVVTTQHPSEQHAISL
jgi:hypothetical protein